MTATAPPAPRDDRDPRVRFLLELATALQLHGTAAHRLEQALESCAGALGLRAQFFATPTSVFCAFGELDDQRVRLLRVNVGEVHLAKLTELYGIWGQVLGGPRRAPIDLAARVRAIVADRAAPPPWLWLAAHALVGGSTARVFGGGVWAVALAATLSALVGAGGLLLPRLPALARVYAPLAAALCAFLASTAAHAVPMAPQLTAVAALIVLLPGFSLTLAMSELAHGHLAAGTARLMGAVVVFLTLAFGIAIGLHSGAMVIPGPPLPPPQLASGLLVDAAAVCAAALGFVVLFRARGKDTVAIVSTCLLSMGGARVGALSFGPELGAFFGAFVVGAVSNWLARLRGVPSAVTALPGITVLVPGSLGMRGLQAMLQRETVAGLQTGFGVVMVASALVTGLLVANLLVPARREL